jgi:leucyl/phenylalanyl-tRNA--protein transferase
MFAHVTNASKAGFITLVRALQKRKFLLVDCQLETDHLLSLGARGVSRPWFLEALERNAYEKTLLGRWSLHAEEGVSVLTFPSNT